MKIILSLLFFMAILFSCETENSSNSEDINKASQIISNSVTSSGGEAYENSTVSFTFRDKKYVGQRNGNDFSLSREFQDSIGLIKDIYSNDEFIRNIDGRIVEVPDSMVVKYEESINSVFYFALLPYKLEDPAVITQYLGEKEIDGKSYDKIKVNFAQEGGGSDYDDNYIYWINKETSFIDYLAYDYTRDEGGMRFRSNFNERIVNGVRFVDAINMKPIDKGSIELIDIDNAFENGKLIELSKIILEDIKVISN